MSEPITPEEREVWRYEAEHPTQPDGPWVWQERVRRLLGALAAVESERDHFKARLAIRYAEMDETRDRLEALANKNYARAEKAETEQAYIYGLARKAHERAEAAERALDLLDEALSTETRDRWAAERALAARDEVIARVQTSLDLLAEMHAKNADIRFGADVVIERVRADLAVPAPQPDEGYQPCNRECNGCPACDPGLTRLPPVEPLRYDCPACGWSQVAHPKYGWQPHDDRAVEVHQQQLCPVHPTPPTTDAEEANGHG